MAQKKRGNKPIQIALTEDQIANIIREAARTRRGLKAESLEERIAPSRFGLPVFGGAEGGLPDPEGDVPPPEDPNAGLPGTLDGGTPGTLEGGGDPLGLPNDPLPEDPGVEDPSVPPEPNDEFFDPNDPNVVVPPPGEDGGFIVDDPNAVPPTPFDGAPPLPEDPFDPNVPPVPDAEPLPPGSEPGFVGGFEGGDAGDAPLPPGEEPGFVPPPDGGEGPLPEGDEGPIGQRTGDDGTLPTEDELREHRENIIRHLRGQ